MLFISPLFKNVVVAVSVAILIQSCSSSSNSPSTNQNASEPGETEMQGSTDTSMDTTMDTPRNCGSDHPAVGQQAELSTLAHYVAGTVSVIDNCTLQITNFTYDGLGPAVYFWAGVSRDFTGPGYFQIGEKINGRRYDDETVVIDLPEDKTLSDFDSLSVWCFEFGVSFGDAMWNGGS